MLSFQRLKSGIKQSKTFKLSVKHHKFIRNCRGEAFKPPALSKVARCFQTTLLLVNVKYLYALKLR